MLRKLLEIDHGRSELNKKNIEQMIMMLSRDIRLFIESVHEEAANMPAEGRPQKIKFQLLSKKNLQLQHR